MSCTNDRMLRGFFILLPYYKCRRGPCTTPPNSINSKAPNKMTLNPQKNRKPLAEGPSSPTLASNSREEPLGRWPREAQEQGASPACPGDALPAPDRGASASFTSIFQRLSAQNALHRSDGLDATSCSISHGKLCQINANDMRSKRKRSSGCVWDRPRDPKAGSTH